MLFRELTAVYCEDHGKYVKTVFKMHSSSLLGHVVDTATTALYIVLKISDKLTDSCSTTNNYQMSANYSSVHPHFTHSKINNVVRNCFALVNSYCSTFVQRYEAVVAVVVVGW